MLEKSKEKTAQNGANKAFAQFREGKDKQMKTDKRTLVEMSDRILVTRGRMAAQKIRSVRNYWRKRNLIMFENRDNVLTSQLTYKNRERAVESGKLFNIIHLILHKCHFIPDPDNHRDLTILYLKAGIRVTKTSSRERTSR